MIFDNSKSKDMIAREGVELNKQTLGYTKKNLQYNSATYEGWSAVSTTLETVVTNETHNGGKVLKYTKPWQYIQPPVRLYKAGTYTISFDAKLDIDSGGTAYIYGLISRGVVVGGKTFKRYSFTFTITEDKEHRLTILMPASPTYSELYIANIQVELGDTATDYEPYADDVDTRLKETVPVERGGTGGTTAREAQYNLLKNMAEATANIEDANYFMGAYREQSKEMGVVYKKTFSHLWDYIKAKAQEIFAPKTQLGGCYLKYENGKYYIGHDDGTTETEV